MSRKTSKGLLPKRMAGVKIPKSVRRGPVGEFLASDAGQKMLAEALLLLGAAVLGGESRKDSRTRKGLQAAADGAGEAVRTAPERLGRAVDEAVRAFRQALETDAGSEADTPAEAGTGPQPARIEAEPAKKKRAPNPPDYGTAH